MDMGADRGSIRASLGLDRFRLQATADGEKDSENEADSGEEWRGAEK